MSQLDDKINQHFHELVVRKDLVKGLKDNIIVPSYVLGRYCATDDETTIQAGINTVRKILSKHYVHLKLHCDHGSACPPARQQSTARSMGTHPNVRARTVASLN